MTDEKKLLVRLKNHSRGALEKVIDIYTPYVTVIVYNVIGSAMSREDVEEVVSDTFLALWRRASLLDVNKGGLRAYLAAIARNGAKNKLRSAFVYEEIDDNTQKGYCDALQNVEREEERKLILDVINSLGQPDSEIFLRYYYYEEKVSKIAEVTGLNASTVKTKLSRGRKRIKEMLVERRYGDE